MNQEVTGRHRNKTLAVLLGLAGGGFGLHRFYLGGINDRLGWAHAASLPLTGALLAVFPGWPPFFCFMPLIVSGIAGWLETLVLGLTPDDKWDAAHNPASGRTSKSRWPLALLLVLTLGVGATGLIAAIARSFDLLFTGGAFG